MDFQFRTEPFPNQLAALRRSCQEESWAEFLEQGLGKTKLAIDTTQYLLLEGKIRALLVVAPNGIHENWSFELDAHMPEAILEHTKIVVWHAKQARTQRKKNEMAALLKFKGLRVLLMSYDATITDLGHKAAKALLSHSRSLIVLDESTAIKSPGARRTKRLLALGKHADYRRILTGTPVANNPMDMFSQMKFLDENFWNSLGCRTFSAYKARFGIWVKGRNGDREFPMLKGFQDLETLSKKVATKSTRQTKAEWLPDLPPKLYSKRPFEMSKEQRKVYTELKEDLMTVIDDELITVEHAMVKLMRLQQVTSGFIGTDEEPVAIPGRNPRLEALLGELEEVQGSALVWTRFHWDVDTIVKKLGDQCTWLDGRVTGEERTQRSKAFADQEVRFLVANPAAVGQGFTWLCATTCIYYTNSFNLNHRLQSEDRPHRIGQKNAVKYVDLVCKDTLDSHITTALRKKRRIAETVTKDEIAQWI